jgi:hypothetical protein
MFLLRRNLSTVRSKDLGVLDIAHARLLSAQSFERFPPHRQDVCRQSLYHVSELFERDAHDSSSGLDFLLSER